MCYSAEIMMVSLCFSLLDITLIIRYMLWGICHILAEWQIVVPLWRLVLCLCVYINIKSRHMVSNQPEVILSRYYFLCSYNLFCMVKLFLEKKKKMEQLGFLTLNGANIGNMRGDVRPFHQKWFFVRDDFVRYLWLVPLNLLPIPHSLVFNVMHIITAVHIILLIHLFTVDTWLSFFHNLLLHLIVMSTCKHNPQKS